ncbi:MAG: hypothetical protein LBO09_09190 [Candidatus Peribacteria bacterium]|jgi:amino acid transporter|nr:hypothetical protein [Candidatus Peribacteria bacterium]
MGTVIGLIIMGLAIIAGLITLLFYRRFKKNVATSSDKEKEALNDSLGELETYLYVCAGFLFYGISVWALDGVACPCKSGGEPFSLGANLLLSILIALIGVGVMWLLYGLLYELLYKSLKESLSKVNKANEMITKKKQKEANKESKKE